MITDPSRSFDNNSPPEGLYNQAVLENNSIIQSDITGIVQFTENIKKQKLMFGETDQTKKNNEEE